MAQAQRFATRVRNYNHEIFLQATLQRSLRSWVGSSRTRRTRTTRPRARRRRRWRRRRRSNPKSRAQERYGPRNKRQENSNFVVLRQIDITYRVTVWSVRLRKRFCKMFSASFPLLAWAAWQLQYSSSTITMSLTATSGGGHGEEEEKVRRR